MPRYRIEQDAPSGRFIIVNSRDPDLIWGGSSWLYRDQSGGTPADQLHRQSPSWKLRQKSSGR
jgi:hypothetical protein